MYVVLIVHFAVFLIQINFSLFLNKNIHLTPNRMDKVKKWHKYSGVEGKAEHLIIAGNNVNWGTTVEINVKIPQKARNWTII